MLGRNVAIILCLFIVITLTACNTSGIRKLSDVETQYFADLKSNVQQSVPRLEALLENRTAVNEEVALQHVARLDENIRRAKLVYSIREVLTAPASNSASFIQVTRNKVILYHLAEMGKARNEWLVARLAKGTEERQQLVNDLNGLNTLLAEVIASNEVLHNYLNKPVTTGLMEFITEVGHQVRSFNETIKAGNQNNTAIRQMMEASKVADQRVQQTEEALLRFIDVWSELNGKTK